MTTIIKVEADRIQVTPSPEHEYVVETSLVAKGYGVTKENIRQHKLAHSDELLEGKHWISVRNANGNPRKGVPHLETLWTKRGIVRLGFFIRSPRARMFRDLAEDLVVGERRAAAVQLPPADVPDLVTQLCGMIRGLGDRVVELERAMLPMQVEHRLVMQDWVRQAKPKPKKLPARTRRTGEPGKRVDGQPDRRAITSPINGRKGGRPRKQ